MPYRRKFVVSCQVADALEGYVLQVFSVLSSAAKVSPAVGDTRMLGGVVEGEEFVAHNN